MKKFLFFIFIFVFLLFPNNILRSQGDPKNGKIIFKNNCTSCHSIDLNKKMIGPPLSGINQKRTKEWLHKWIKDNKSLRNKGDKEAIKIYQEYGKIEMNAFPQLSDSQIDDILSFIEHPDKQDYKKNNNNIENIQEKIDNKTVFLSKLFILFLSILSILLTFLLYRIYILSKVINKGEDPIFTKLDVILSFLYSNILKKSIKNWYILFSIISILLLFSIYLIWNFLMNLDVNKGYKPVQPIYFSHKIHSKINKIDCQYCHSSAKYGKVAGIPSANVCMNCHMTINEYTGNYIEKNKSKEEYTKEIQKIYNAIGWNPEKRQYTGKTIPIKWIRIHNMPDFVYFDHSRHIISGEQTIKKLKKVDDVCNACHGDVKNMDRVEMSNNFTMEWCLSCHREIKNNVKDFYKTNEKNKIDMSESTECAKCHY